MSIKIWERGLAGELPDLFNGCLPKGKKPKPSYPDRYVLNLDDWEEGEGEDGTKQAWYIGKDEYIIIPEKYVGYLVLPVNINDDNWVFPSGIAGTVGSFDGKASIMLDMLANTSQDNLELKYLDVSSVTDMGEMFLACKSLTTLDVSGWDVSSVTNMEYMFKGCDVLESLYCRTEADADKLTEASTHIKAGVKVYVDGELYKTTDGIS